MLLGLMCSLQRAVGQRPERWGGQASPAGSEGKGGFGSRTYNFTFVPVLDKQVSVSGKLVSRLERSQDLNRGAL